MSAPPSAAREEHLRDSCSPGVRTAANEQLCVPHPSLFLTGLFEAVTLSLCHGRIWDRRSNRLLNSLHDTDYENLVEKTHFLSPLPEHYRYPTPSLYPDSAQMSSPRGDQITPPKITVHLFLSPYPSFIYTFYPLFIAHIVLLLQCNASSFGA